MNGPEYLLDIIFLGLLLLEPNHSRGIPKILWIVSRRLCEHRTLVENVHEGLEFGETKLLRTWAIIFLDVLKGWLICTEDIQEKIDNNPGQSHLLFLNLVDEFTLSNDAVLIFVTSHEKWFGQQQELEINLKTSYAFLNLLLFKFVELILRYRSYNSVGLRIFINIHHSWCRRKPHNVVRSIILDIKADLLVSIFVVSGVPRPLKSVEYSWYRTFWLYTSAVKISDDFLKVFGYGLAKIDFLHVFLDVAEMVLPKLCLQFFYLA